jgi:hypothetical protein
MRIKPEEILEKYGIAAIGFHEERLTRSVGTASNIEAGSLQADSEKKESLIGRYASLPPFNLLSQS